MSKCKQKVDIPDSVLKDLGIEKERITFYEGKGCDDCHQTKYAGRTTIHEFLILTEEVKGLISKRASEQEIITAARKTGMKSLKDSGIEKAKQGLTSLEEVLNITGLTLS